MSESDVVTPICRICSLPKVRGRLWGWRCTLCDTRPVRHGPRYHTQCLACGTRFRSSDIKQVTKFQNKHDHAKHDGASAWSNNTRNDNPFISEEER